MSIRESFLTLLSIWFLSLFLTSHNSTISSYPFSLPVTLLMNHQRPLPGCLVNDSVQFTSQTTQGLTQCLSLPCIYTLDVMAAETSFAPLELSALSLVLVTASFEGLFSAAPLFEPTGETSSLATWAVILSCASVIRRSISAVSTEDFRLQISSRTVATTTTSSMLN